ncbi:MAG: 6-phosphogluconolactonase [Paraglaciecola sp.]|nr:6-phosphogluconolactonase [Paraglaciecola sp.]
MPLRQSLFETPDALNQDFCQRISAILQAAIETDGRASLVVSGGRTPAALFEALSHVDLAWSKVDISLADERWVDVENDASNEKMVRAKLLVNKAAEANFVGLKTVHANAQDAIEACNTNFANFKRPFDVLILGMGEDGHTASLFPCSTQIAAGLDLDSGETFIAVQPTTAPNQRMSFTLPALVSSKHVFLHLTGDAKREVLAKALADNNELEMPIRAILNNVNVELMWAP